MVSIFDLHQLMLNNKAGDVKSRFLWNVRNRSEWNGTEEKKASIYLSVECWFQKQNNVHILNVIRHEFLFTILLKAHFVVLIFFSLVDMTFLNHTRDLTSVWLSHNKSICKHIIFFLCVCTILFFFSSGVMSVALPRFYFSLHSNFHNK